MNKFDGRLLWLIRLPLGIIGLVGWSLLFPILWILSPIGSRNLIGMFYRSVFDIDYWNDWRSF